LRVLERLRAGPATNGELARIGGLRYGGRIFELRQMGYDIRDARIKGGIFLYTLRAEP
jgi:hypothetical protein